MKVLKFIPRFQFEEGPPVHFTRSDWRQWLLSDGAIEPMLGTLEAHREWKDWLRLNFCGLPEDQMAEYREYLGFEVADGFGDIDVAMEEEATIAETSAKPCDGR